MNRSASPSQFNRAASPSYQQRDASPSQRSSATPAHQTTTASRHGEHSRESTPHRDQQRGSTPSRQTTQSRGQTNNKAEPSLSLKAVVAVQDKNRRMSSDILLVLKLNVLDVFLLVI